MARGTHRALGALASWAVLTLGLGLAAGEPAAARAWSPFEPIVEPRVPAVDDPEWAASPIDAFILAALRERGLTPAPAVDRRVWLRRVTFDLTGLPPSPEELRQLLADPRPDPEAFAAVVDRLLASPAYGERWARHWLDVVRYGDSDGFAIDSERPTLWRYRDYVIRALNEDRPFDRLIREHIAGDELEGAGPDGLIATGFYRLGPWEADNMVKEDRRQDYLNEVTAATGAAFLGLTFACARCHDHKYDPIPTRDFYGLQAFFSPLDRAERPLDLQPAEVTPAVDRSRAAAAAERARLEAAVAAHLGALRGKLAAAAGKPPEAVTDAELEAALKTDQPFSREEKKKLEQLRKAAAEEPAAKRFAASVVGIQVKGGKETPACRVLLGGDLTAPGDEVEPCFPSAVKTRLVSAAALLAQEPPATGRRAALAAWLSSSENPLTPRVLANRVWQYHLGQGIVATANDFGRNGSGASHPALLDFLAQRLTACGWRLKPLHRLIVLSRTYRTSAVHPHAERCEELDPQDRLLWRAQPRRLEAETLRDAILQVSGRLSLERGGPGFHEELPRELGREFPFFTWDASSDAQRSRRSIYMFQRRNLVVPLLEAFDAADMSESCERRRTSVTATQALSLWNGKFASDGARRFALRVLGEVGLEVEDQVGRAIELAFSRAATPEELERGVEHLRAAREDHASRVRPDDGKAGLLEPDIAALADLCLVILNANEFVYLE